MSEKVYTYDEQDLVFAVEAYKRAEDEIVEEMCEFCLCADEVDDEEFDYFRDTFDSFDEAVKKYVELLNAGWEVVRIYITPKKTRKGEVDFSFQKDLVSIRVNVERINRDLVSTLRKIKNALDESDIWLD